MKTELMDNRKPDYILLINWTHQSLSSLPVTLKAFLLFSLKWNIHCMNERTKNSLFLCLLWFGRNQFYFHIKKRMYCLQTFTNDLVFWFCLFWFFHNWYCYLEGFRWVTLFLRRCLAERNTRAASVLSSSSSQLRPPLWQSPKIW